MRYVAAVMVVIFALCGGRLSARTIFLYLEESCNGARGLYLTTVKEGVIDSLFDAGHIVFDDALDRGGGARLAAYDFAVPLAAARRGGADALLAVSIESTAMKPAGDPKAPEKIESRGTWALIEAGTGRKLAGGTLLFSNQEEAKAGMDRSGFGLALGRTMGCDIAAAAGKDL